jgi:hypothetical protein
MGAPQIIMIVLLALGVGISIASHGKPRPPHHGIASAVGAGVTAALLWWGGFFG